MIAATLIPELASPQRSAPAQPTGSKLVPLKICIASPEFVGLTADDKIGMAYTAMAQALAASGHHVTCLYLGAKEPSNAIWQKWVEKYKTDGLTLIAVPSINASELVAPINLIKSYETYQWLKRNDRFDIIHFPEQRGPGYHTLTAKHHGLAFNKATICVGLHSMAAWLNTPQATAASEMSEVDTDFMERRVVALADTVVSPSHYLIDWISEQQWEMPRREEVKPAPTRLGGLESTPLAAPATADIDELVYFGPLESRKGITLFCDALDCIPSNLASKIKKVTFLGRESIVDGIPSWKYVENRAKNWPFPCELLSGHVPYGPVHYLRHANRLTVIPALMEISPYRVLECLVAKVPFIASSIGGIAELIAPDDAPKVCFEPNVGALCASLCLALTEGHRPASPATDTRAHAEAWLNWQENTVLRVDQASQISQAAIQALSIDPNNIVALKALARIHLNARCYEAALEACQLILKNAPADAEASQMCEEAQALARNAVRDFENSFDTNLFNRARNQVCIPDAAEQFA